MFPPLLINSDRPIIGENHNITTGEKKKKNNQINLDQNPETAAARSTFPPSLINPDQPIIGENHGVTKKKKKKKPKTLKPKTLNMTRIATYQKKRTIVMCDVDVGRSMVFGFEERREHMRKREGRERREQK